MGTIMSKIHFIGTGSGDVGMLLQKINTSSFYIELDNVTFIMDPGPGTIVHAIKAGIELFKIDGLVVTHPHPDHYADANCLIDALRKQGTFLVAGKICLLGSEMYYPCINKFQQTIPENVFGIEHGEKVEVKGITFEGVKNNHVGCGLGLKIMGTKKIGYVNDGSLEGIAEFYHDMDVLIFNVLIPYGKPAMPNVHTNVDQVIEFLNKTKPKQAIIQHFSLEMLDAGIDKQAQIIQDQTGVKTTAAKDGMIFEL